MWVEPNLWTMNYDKQPQAEALSKVLYSYPSESENGNKREAQLNLPAPSPTGNDFTCLTLHCDFSTWSWIKINSDI